MWQSQSRRTRADLNKRRAQARNKLHVTRVEAELQVPAHALGEDPSVVGVRIILNDIHPRGVGIFSPQPLRQGQELALSLEYPKRIFLKAKVLWSEENLAHVAVLTDKPYPHRAGLAFLFNSQEEKDAVASYFKELLDWLSPAKKAA